MSITTYSRRSTPDELAAEMDRRGGVIAKLEDEITRLTQCESQWRHRAEVAESALVACMNERHALRAALSPSSGNESMGAK